MSQYILFGLTAVATLVAWHNWRWGLYAMVVVALAADPLRKITPGTPSYLVLTVVPVWACVLVNAWRSGALSLRGFQAAFPRLWRLVVFYLLALPVPAVLSATYAPGSWRYTLLGGYMQMSLLVGLLLGFGFPRRPGDIERLLKWYCLAVGLMMLGAPLERWQIGVDSGLVGTGSMGTYWVTYRTGQALRMVSGFFRSPDIMGWHAATLVMFSVTLALKSARWGRVGWAALAGWGVMALMFCARRKMVSMVPVFGGVMLALYVVHGHARLLMRLMLALGVMVVMGAYVYFSVGANEDVERFYSTTVGELDERVQQHGVDSVIDTFEQAGFFGYGLGMAVQGVHNIRGPRPRIWQESGPSMLAAELGVPGMFAFVLLLAGLMVTGYRSLQTAALSTEHALFLGVGATVVANLAAGVVSSQIFGDPFVSSILPFLAGVVLAGARLQPVAPEPGTAPGPAGEESG